MKSLPTGLMQSWLIVATVALSPIIILFLADIIGRVLRPGKGKRGVSRPGEGRDRLMNGVRNWAVGSAIAALVLPQPPLSRFLMVIASEMVDRLFDGGEGDRGLRRCRWRDRMGSVSQEVVAS